MNLQLFLIGNAILKGLVIGTLFPRKKSEVEKHHVFKVSCCILNEGSQPGIESFITGLEFLQNESRLLEWTPVFRKYPNFDEIPVDLLLFSVFERDKAEFMHAIRGRRMQRVQPKGYS